MTKHDAVIVDVDGTLVNVDTIRHYVVGDHKDYDHFHKASTWCPANQWVIDAIQERESNGQTILVVTARAERFRAGTVGWLDGHNVPYESLHMRANGDERHDSDIKRDILRQLQKRYTITAAYDDNPHIIALWRAERIPEIIEVPGYYDDKTMKQN